MESACSTRSGPTDCQTQGLDPVEVNEALGFRDDEREYSIATHMLKSLKVQSIQLLTKNPRKVAELARYGIRIPRRPPHAIPPNEQNRFHLETKALKSLHFIDLGEKPHLPGQGETVRVGGKPGGIA